MKILGIDTSSKSLSAAILEDGRLLISCEKIFGLRHSQDLVPTIKGLLEQTCLTINNIDGIAVSLGPGSFTGLRVGVTAAKTLSIIKNKPVAGVPTLDAIAYNAYYYPGMICSLLDARKQMVYAAVYERKSGRLIRKSGYLLLPVDELMKTINQKTLFIGDGIAPYGKTIKRLKRRKAEFAPERLWLPRAETVAFLGWRRLKDGGNSDAPDLAPLYLHSRECNVKK